MTRTKQNKKRSKTNGRKPVKRLGKTKLGSMTHAVANQLIDPCNAIPMSPYWGERGLVQRFVQDATYNVAGGHTCGFVVFTPGSNSVAVNTTLSPSTPIAPLFFTGPGSPFVGASASKIRSCGACITTVPSAVSVTNMTGELGMAIITANTLSTLGTYSVDGVFQLTNVRKILQKTEFETKWFPGELDHTYAPVFNTGPNTGTASLSDPSDQNSILVAYRGYPPGAALSFRFTNIIEWTPVSSIGLSVTSASSVGAPYKAIAAKTHQADPSWWHTHSKDVKMHLGNAGAKLLNAGIDAAARYAVEAMEAGAA